MSADRESSPFEQLGRHLAAGMGDGPSQERQMAQRARLVAWASGSRQHTGFWQRLDLRWTVGGGMAAVAGAVAVLFLVLSGPAQLATEEGPRPLTAELDHSPLGDHAWVTAAQTEATLTFSDDSRFVLQPGARARVAKLDEAGLHLSLEAGRLEASVTPNGPYTWQVAAGPYRVTVVGTVFSVDWSPETHELAVAVSRGQVRVTEPGNPGLERTLHAGDRLSMQPPQAAAVEIADLPKAEPAESSVVRSKPMSPGRRPAPEAAVSVPSSREAVPEAPSTEPEPIAPTPTASATAHPWRELAKAGQFHEAIQAARLEDVDKLVSSASASDLLLLADTARLTGSSELAQRALAAIRKRFPGHPNAAVAAYSLGRLAAETGTNQQDAIRWFKVYLKAAPSGGFAESARARLLTAYMGLGERGAARKAARDYLKHHPSGRHASVARSLLDD